MRKVLAIVLLVALGAYGIVWIDAIRESGKAASQPWPDDLGTIKSFAERFPRQTDNAAAQKLNQLVAPLGFSFARSQAKDDAAAMQVSAGIHDYLSRETASGTVAIGEPPSDVATYLGSQVVVIAAIREHLLSGDAIAWQRDLATGYGATTPNLVSHLRLARLLVTNALLRARNADAGAWTDLQAAWNLSRSLHDHPELMTQLVALAMTRTINAATWKMPLPAPAWLAEMGDVDHVRLLLRSIQYEQWLLWRYGPAAPARASLVVAEITKPFTRIELSRAIQKQLAIAQTIASATRCNFDASALYGGAAPNLASAWQRAFRHRAERETALNALRARSAGAVDPKSRCSDGTWSFEGTWVRFSRDIPKAQRDAVLPLALRVR